MKKTELTNREWEILHWEDRKWDTASEKIMADCLKFVETDPFASMDIRDMNLWSTYIYIKAGWGCEVTLRIDLCEEYVENREKNALAGRVDCELSWSSTSRNTAKAMAAIQLYQRALNFAMLIESKYEDLYLIEDEEQK